MEEDSAEMYDIAIIGYGPVGAVLANLLGRDGFRVVVFERDREIYRLPRAVHFDHEIMRIFQSLGLADDLVSDTAPLEGCDFWNADRKTLFGLGMGQGITHQGWRQDYMFHQPGLESVLRAAVAARAGVAVHLEHEVTGLREHDADVEVDVHDRSRAAARTLRARYVVGCDGANSFVRKQMGLQLDDLEFDEPWLVVDAKIAKPRQELGLPGPAIQLCDPARPTTFVPVAGPYIRWEFMLRPGETKEEMLRPEHVSELISKWTDPRDVEIIRTAVYDFHALLAATWNTRRVFLAGDSAHQMPPFLGQGMCSGIRDAANLAWKLGLVLRGGAGEAMLASYQSERAPHVRAIIDLAISMGRIICTQDPVAAAARDADLLSRPQRGQELPGMPGLGAGVLQSGSAFAGKLGLQARVRDKDGAAALLDDVVGPGFTLLVHGQAAPLRQRAQEVLERTGTRLVSLDPSFDIDGAYRAWFEGHACDALLVRPDHIVFGAAAGQAAASTLLEELGGCL